MYGNILYGSGFYADTLFGVYLAEITSDITQSTLRTKIRMHGALSSYPSVKARDTLLDFTFNSRTSNERYIPKLGIGLYGNFDEFGLESVLSTRLRFDGVMRVSEDILDNILNIGIGLKGVINLDHPDKNTIAWADIGSVDFVINQSNIAGKLPLPWNGYVYKIELLNNSSAAYVYGTNGITVIKAAGIYFDNKTISSLGLKNKDAMVNTGSEHYFILTNNRLCRITSEGQKVILGYAEFLSTLSDVVMSYDNYNNLIYICDGVKGYIYSIDSDSFTTGPKNITGINYNDDVFYALDSLLIAASEAIVIPDFEIVTDIYDFGTKKEKTIFNIMLDVNYTANLKAGIDFRTTPNDAFTSIPMVNINPHGIAEVPCYGREFRFRLSGNTGEDDFKLSSITVSGVIHGFSFLDTIAIK